MTLNFKVGLDDNQIHISTTFRGPRYYSYRDMNYCLVNFGPVTDGQTQSDAYEPTVHKHRWAQKPNPLTLPADVPTLASLMFWSPVKKFPEYK